MKSLVFIISVYFLFLAVLPCHCDIQDINSLSQNTEQLSSTPDNDLTHEICTPFCACSSHHNPNFIVNYEVEVLNASVGIKHITFYNDTEIPSHSKSLWRPPQV